MGNSNPRRVKSLAVGSVTGSSVGLPSGYLVFKYVRRAISDAGRRFWRGGDCQFILMGTAIDWLLIERGRWRIDSQRRAGRKLDLPGWFRPDGKSGDDPTQSGQCRDQAK